MAMEIVKPKLDVVFKKIFCDVENREILKCFLADIIEIPAETITDITIENTEGLPSRIDEKFVRFDMVLTTNKGLINVEIQLNNNGSFPERSLYYWAKRYGEQLNRGDSYDDIQPTISIYIVDFKMFDTADFYSYYTMADLKHQKILTDKCAIYFFELPKLDKNYDADNKKKLWMQFINAESESDLEMLEKTAVPEIQSGVRVVYNLSQDAILREMARVTEKRVLDERSALRHAKSEGLAEGRAEGRAEGLAEGRAEGLTEGIAKGLAEGRTAMIAEMRKHGIDEALINQIAESLKMNHGNH